MLRHLLIGIGQFDQSGFGPSSTEECYSGWEFASDETHGNRDAGTSGFRGKRLAVVPCGRIEVADEPRRVVPGWIDYGRDKCLLHCAYNGLTASSLGFSAFCVVRGTNLRCFCI